MNNLKILNWKPIFIDLMEVKQELPGMFEVQCESDIETYMSAYMECAI